MQHYRRWAFDLDGTLVDSFGAVHRRPFALELLEALQDRGCTVVLWSAGGVDYAQRVAQRIGIDHTIDEYYPKVRGENRRWTLDIMDLEHRPDVCVDDQTDSLPLGIGTVGVFPYLGPNLHDRALESILVELID